MTRLWHIMAKCRQESMKSVAYVSGMGGILN